MMASQPHHRHIASEETHDREGHIHGLLATAGTNHIHPAANRSCAKSSSVFEFA